MPIPLGILAVAGAGAGGAASSFDLLETTLTTGNTASVTFSNLNNYSDYKHLQVRATLRGNLASDSTEELAIRLNADTGNNYASHRLNATGSAVNSSANTSFSTMRIGVSPFTTGSIYGAIIVDVLDFSNTSKNTTLRALSGAAVANAGADKLRLSSGLWINTAAVTSLQIYIEGVDITSGSRFSLYGVK